MHKNKKSNCLSEIEKWIKCHNFLLEKIVKITAKLKFLRNKWSNYTKRDIVVSNKNMCINIHINILINMSMFIKKEMRKIKNVEDKA